MLLRPLRLFAAAAIALAGAGCTKETVIQAPTPPTSTPPTSAAPIARLALSVSGTDGLIAFAGQGVVTLDARASSGTGLRYGLDFGDGTGADEALATRTYATAGNYRVRALVTDAFGRTDDVSLMLTVSNMRTEWSSAFLNPRNKMNEYRRLIITSQSGRRLSGDYVHPSGARTPVQGELIGDRGFRVSATSGVIEFTSTAEGVDVSGQTVSMAVRGGSADGMTLRFSRFFSP
ncbi:MAG: PKD domain-containing protein [Vicinamibacterales bacterium]